MAANYDKLWKLLIDKKMKRTDLHRLAGISTTTIAKLGKDEYVSMECIQYKRFGPRTTLPGPHNGGS